MSILIRAKDDSLERFVGRCADGLVVVFDAVAGETNIPPSVLYTQSIKYVVRMLAVLIAAERISTDVSAAASLKRASDAVFGALEDSSGDSLQSYTCAIRDVAASSGSIFELGNDLAVDRATFTRLAETLLRPQPEAPIERLFFETVPLTWLGRAYQRMLALRPAEDGLALRPDASHRKGRGVFFTPPHLVSYIIESVLAALVDSCTGIFEGASLAERIGSLKLLDPAMGGGDFLISAVDFLSECCGSGGSDNQQMRARFASECVYGVDIDPVAVDIARFCVWAASGYADGISEAINSHLICANALGVRHEDEAAFDWEKEFGEVFSALGFDAVVGNPPYVASKNGMGAARLSTSGQSDFYLMFLSAAISNNLVKPGGLFSMVLPDPMLVRENAAQVRRKLLTGWTVLSLLHISEAFQEAQVANVVPVCRNRVSSAPEFCVSRIERVGDRHSFSLRPRQTALALAHPVRKSTILAQDRYEILYLLEQGSFGDIVRRIHGDDVCLSQYQLPFAPLRKLNVKKIFRGEEVGKAAINSEAGDLHMLLGGQSVQPYGITWEGRRTVRSWVRKPLERYLSTKILIQKSAARLVAALDRVTDENPGYVFPQSVYGVQLLPGGMSEAYLLCILNSQVMNEYIWRAVTGYKLLQPQIELEDIRALPIRCISFTTPVAERESDVAKGIRLFENESRHWVEGYILSPIEGSAFPRLANFVRRCLTGVPEKSDVVHYLLDHLGNRMVELVIESHRSPDADVTRRLEFTRAAIETVVWCLYSSEPAQMTLSW